MTFLLSLSLWSHRDIYDWGHTTEILADNRLHLTKRTSCVCALPTGDRSNHGGPFVDHRSMMRQEYTISTTRSS